MSGAQMRYSGCEVTHGQKKIGTERARATGASKHAKCRSALQVIPVGTIGRLLSPETLPALVAALTSYTKWPAMPKARSASIITTNERLRAFLFMTNVIQSPLEQFSDVFIVQAHKYLSALLARPNYPLIF